MALLLALAWGMQFKLFLDVRSFKKKLLYVLLYVCIMVGILMNSIKASWQGIRISLFIICTLLANFDHTIPSLASLVLNGEKSNSLHALKFEISSSETGIITHESKIECYRDEQKIGSISYTKFPLFNFYVIHTFYIEVENRNKGYGKELLNYSCNHLHKKGAKRIYIQPGPFEIIEGTAQNIYDASRKAKIGKLITLYKKAGFVNVSTYISLGVSLLYKVLGIYEDANYLLVKIF